MHFSRPIMIKFFLTPGFINVPLVLRVLVAKGITCVISFDTGLKKYDDKSDSKLKITETTIQTSRKKIYAPLLSGGTKTYYILQWTYL